LENASYPCLTVLNGIARAGITCGDWIVASDKQIGLVGGHAQQKPNLFSPKPGQKPRTAFLGKLSEIINTAVRAAA
jgi:hypothetical protein